MIPPQANGICERFHRTTLDEFYQVTFRKKTICLNGGLQKNQGDWLKIIVLIKEKCTATEHVKKH
ncbi:conserved hypothetical protein [Vibrio chagasii]|nr:conserved hypothetical protein [Vibrio chagasii]CAH7159657.1 conserved hypothetical protein [Vibrio chagasii]CAH7193526.1 conserved hypothetical protein [Vibrio chagasii]CAH7232387.1 conserved hypothetical protein [Vibrio chagasii]CAH7240052.1 conserved hypothetical protein [Vibrio chagasii]